MVFLFRNLDAAAQIGAFNSSGSPPPASFMGEEPSDAFISKETKVSCVKLQSSFIWQDRQWEMETIKKERKKNMECHEECGWFTGYHVSCSSRAASLPRESVLFCKHTNAAAAAADANLNIYEPLG